MNRLITLLMAFIMLPGYALGAILDLRPGESHQPVMTLESFDSQAGDDQDIHARLQNQQGSWVSRGEKIADAFSTVWLRVNLQNDTDETLQRILYLPNNFAARSFDFYIYRNGVFLEHKSYQQDKALEGDELIGRSNYSSFAAPPRSNQSIYIKIDTGYEPLNQNFQVSARQVFINWEVISTFFVGIYLGILFLTIIANLMQAAAYRDKTFLFYAAYCACILFTAFSFFGIGVRFFGMFETQRIVSYLGSNLLLIAGTWFVRSVLDTDAVAPRLSFVLRMVPYFALVSIALRFIPATTSLGYALFNLNSILFNSLACTLGVIAIVQRRELAWLYTGSFLVFAVSIIYLRLANLNIIAPTPVSFYAPAFGQILQITALSYMMFARGRTAYREMLNGQRNRSMNERLNLLLKIISHDIANPLQAISLYCNMALDKAKANKIPQRELERAMEAVDSQARIIRHAKEAVRQMQLGQKLQIQAIHVSQILSEILQVFQPLCQDRGIHLQVSNELREDCLMHTDPTVLVHSIFGNILSNSIKYSPPGSTITIRVRLTQRRLTFDLGDNGPGISKDKRMEIFTLNLGKSFNEQLTGAGSFGLSILQMCSELLHGHLDIGPSEISASGQEMGLRISVSLPLHHAL